MAFLCAFAVFFIENLAIFAYGAKSCGDLSWGFYDALYLTPYYLVLPWFNLPILLAFVFGGFMYPNVQKLRLFLGVTVIALGIAVPLVTALMAARASFACQPI